MSPRWVTLAQPHLFINLLRSKKMVAKPEKTRLRTAPSEGTVEFDPENGIAVEAQSCIWDWAKTAYRSPLFTFTIS